MSGPVDDLRRRQRQEWWVLAVALLAGLLLLLALRWKTHGDVDAAERRRLDEQARIVQSILARQVESVYTALVGVREDASLWSGENAGAGASRRLKAMSDAIAGLQMMARVDARGGVVAASRLTMIGTDIGERLPRAVPGTLAVGLPRRDAGGQMSLDLVLGVPQAEGGGAILGSLDADYFRLVMRTVLYAPDMRVGLAHGAGQVLMFEPPRPDTEGLNVARPGSLFERHLASGRDDNVFVGRTQTSAEPRYVAYRSLRPPQVPMDVPLLLAVSRDVDAVFAPWREQTAWSAGLYALFSAGLVLALAQLQKRQTALLQLQQAADRRQRAEAERLALALNGADLGLWDRDLRGDRTEFNDRWAEMLGRRPQDIARDVAGWRSLVHPEDLPRVEAAFDAHLQGRTPAYEAVYRMRHQAGHWVWILSRGKVLERAADGAPLRVLGTHMDLSQRIEAEQALRDRERQLASVADAVPGPVSRVDRDGRYLFANAAYERWFGVAGARVLGRTQREVLGEQRYVHVEPHVRQVLDGDSVSYETPVRTADGLQRWALVSLVPDRDAQGAVVGHFTVLYDISDRKRAEDALRSSERQTRALLDNLMVGVVVHRPDTQVLDANPMACRLLGLTLEQMRGRVAVDPGWRFVEEDGQTMPLPRYPVQRVVASGQPVSNLVGGIVQPGSDQTTWVLCNAFPVRRADGAVEQIIVTFLDITDRRAAELERQTLERQLRESQRMESIGTLAGGIAHDFNNILAAILGNTALARQDAGPGHPVQASLEQIHKAGLRARSLVQQILAFSRRDPGLLRVQALNGVLDETLALLRATLPASVRLEPQLAGAEVPVRADATQLQQVLMNLATNAWHALPPGGGRIEIGMERLAADTPQLPPGLPAGAVAHVWVRDNGSGMDAATRARIFDPFFTTKPVGQGTGLGLSVVHGIVRAHQGVISVDSTPGAGSCFHLYFHSPEDEGADGADEAAGAAGADEADATGGPQGDGRHVLYVDDDEVMVLMAERLLQRAGYRVSTCASAVEALARVGAAPQGVDIVVTDFNMPDMSGLELVSALAALRADLPVVLSSGLLSEDLRQRAQALGVRALLHKENSFEELASTIARVLAPA